MNPSFMCMDIFIWGLAEQGWVFILVTYQQRRGKSSTSSGRRDLENVQVKDACCRKKQLTIEDVGTNRAVAEKKKLYTTWMKKTLACEEILIYVLYGHAGHQGVGYCSFVCTIPHTRKRKSCNQMPSSASSSMGHKVLDPLFVAHLEVHPLPLVEERVLCTDPFPLQSLFRPLVSDLPLLLWSSVSS